MRDSSCTISRKGLKRQALIESEIEHLTPEAIGAGLGDNLARRREHTQEIYLHIDLDSLDP